MQVQSSWPDHASSMGLPTSAASVATQSPPGFSHVTPPPGFALGCAATPVPAPGTPGYPQCGGPPGPPGYPHGGGPPGSGPNPGTPGHGQPHHGQPHHEEFGGKVKAAAAKLPKLELKGVDAPRLLMK
eukprot:6462882-Amphidinium_carterae.1